MVRCFVQHVLSAEELKVVAAFGVEVERLWVTPIAGQGEERTFLKVENHFDRPAELDGKAPKMVGQMVTTPTDDALAALQRQFRVFILASEPTNFLSVRKLVWDSFSAAQVEDPGGILKQGQVAWSLPMLSLLGCPVQGQDLIDWWFNAELFHRNTKKQVKLNALRAAVGEARLRVWLVFAFIFAQGVIIEFHTFLRDETDLYDG